MGCLVGKARRRTCGAFFISDVMPDSLQEEGGPMEQIGPYNDKRKAIRYIVRVAAICRWLVTGGMPALHLARM